MKKTARFAAVAAIAALSLAACGDRPDEDDHGRAHHVRVVRAAESSATAEPIDFKACMVSDSGGFDDKSFNQTSHEGPDRRRRRSWASRPARSSRKSDTEYADNIQRWSTRAATRSPRSASCSVTRPWRPRRRTRTSTSRSSTSPTRRPPAKNLKGLTFNTAEPSFLAGYLAAAKSETGTVGTFGGLNIPTVTIFMTGFLQGVEKYNEDNGGDVQVLGWDGKDGSFTEDFEDKTKGQTIAEQLIQQGADVIMPGRRSRRPRWPAGRPGQRRLGHLGRHRRLRVGRRVLRHRC